MFFFCFLPLLLNPISILLSFLFLAGSQSHAETESSGTKTSSVTTSRRSIEERRHSSTTQDINDYIYSEEQDVDDDDVFEMEPSGGGAEPSAVPGNSTSSSTGSAVGGAERASEAKRRTQSLGSLTGEPKSPRKVLSVFNVNNLVRLLSSSSFPISTLPPPFPLTRCRSLFFLCRFLASPPPFLLVL